MNLGESYINNLINVYNDGNICKPRNKEIRELLGVTINGKADESNVVLFPSRNILDITKPEGSYLAVELMWYMSGDKSANFIKNFGTIWNNITNDDGTLNSNYGEKVFHNYINNDFTRYEWALNSIKNYTGVDYFDEFRRIVYQ